MCNYRAMNPEKLQRCIHELQNKHGDAWERVVSKGESVDAHLSAALSAASMKGLGDLPDLEAGEEGEPRTPGALTGVGARFLGQAAGTAAVAERTNTPPKMTLRYC